MTIRMGRTPSRGPAVVMAAGLGWIGGHFAGPGSTDLLVAAVHLIPVALVLVAITDLAEPDRVRRGTVVLTALAVGIKVVTVFALVWAITHPTGFGPHSVADWVPIGLANAGGGLWLRGVLFGPRPVPA